VDIQLEGQNIPLGTTVTVTVVNESEELVQVLSSPLAGTEALSTASATVIISPGFSQIFTRARWQP
jgi:hypothetical protein